MLVAAAAVASLARHDQPSPSRSTLNPAPAGTQALFRVLQALDVPVKRSRRPIPDLRLEHGLLVMVSPFESSVSSKEANAILAWVKRGNVLLFCPEVAEWLNVSGWLDGSFTLLEKLGWSRDDLDRLGGSAEQMSERLAAGPSDTDLSAAIASPVFVPGQRMVTGASVRVPAPHGPWATLVTSDLGAQAWERPLGRGRVVVLAAPGLLENRRIDRAANLSFVLGLLESLRGDRTVLFEETTHGHLDATPQLTLDRGARRVLAAQLLLALGVYVVSRGRRLGPVASAPRAPSRSAVELAESMAALYRRAGVAGEALAELWRDAPAAAHDDPELASEVVDLLAAGRVRESDLLRLDREMNGPTAEGRTP